MPISRQSAALAIAATTVTSFVVLLLTPAVLKLQIGISPWLIGFIQAVILCLPLGCSMVSHTAYESLGWKPSNLSRSIFVLVCATVFWFAEFMKHRHEDFKQDYTPLVAIFFCTGFGMAALKLTFSAFALRRRKRENGDK